MSPAERFRRSLRALSARGSLFEHPHFRRIGILLAIGAFLIGLFLALKAHPNLLGLLDYRSWLLVFPLVPLTFLANSIQFWLTARLIGVDVKPSRAVIVTVVSAAANMLPIPGGSVVRIAALKTSDNTYQQTSLVTLFVAGCWLGVTLVIAGSSLVWLSFSRAGLVCLGIGMVVIFVFGWLIVKGRQAVSRWLTMLLAVHATMIAVGTVRLWLCFSAVGHSVEITQAAVLTLSNVIASLIGIAPAGLGITETLAAGLAAAIGLTAAPAFLAAVLNRISNLLVIGPAALLLHAMNSTSWTSQAVRTISRPRK